MQSNTISKGDTVLLMYTGKQAKVVQTYKGPLSDRIAVEISGKDYSKTNCGFDIVKKAEVVTH